MKFSKEKDERLLNILSEAYREKENRETGNEWQQKVMRGVQAARNREATPDSSVGFFQFAWRLAPATALLILALTALLIGSGLSSGYGVFEVGLDGLEELSLTETTTT